MKKTNICNITCIALMGILLALHFMPFWGEGELSVAIQPYVWFPSNYDGMDYYFLLHGVDRYSINNMVLMPVVVIITTVVGIILNIIMRDNILVGLIPIVCGLTGIWGYITKDEFQLGANWGIHLIICFAIVAAAVLKEFFVVKTELE